MVEQLPDGFGRSDSAPPSDFQTRTLYDSYGRKLKEVPTIPQSQRDAFAKTGVGFDGFAQANHLRKAEEDITDSIVEELKLARPEFRKLIDPVFDEDED